ncbi:MAG: 50S ribosomal protein L21 [Phycisphaerales bacterium]
MYAIIEESGGQRKVESGDVVLVDLLDAGAAAPGKQISFDKVLLIGGKDGAAVRIGQPYVAGASVSAEVVEGVVQGEKLRIQYFQPKKNSRRRTGHRQRYTRVKITAING